MAFLKSFLNVLARTSDDLGQVLANHGDEFMDAIRSGRGTQYLEDLGDVGRRVLANDEYLRTIGRLGDDAGQLLDDVDALISNGDDATESIARLFGGADNIPAGLTSKLDEAASVARETAEQLDNTAGMFDNFNAQAALSATGRAARAPFRFIRDFLTGNPTRGGLILASVGPATAVYGYALLDKQLGGEITYNAALAFKDSVVSAYEHVTQDMTQEERQEWLANRIHEAETVTRVLNTDLAWQAGLNMTVAGAMTQDGATVEDGKNAAIAYQLTNAALNPVFWLKTNIRSMVIDEVYEGESQEFRDEQLAAGLIRDLIKTGDCAAMRDHEIPEITGQDLVNTIKDHPEQIAPHIPERIRNGLMQLYPDAGLEEIFSQVPTATISPAALADADISTEDIRNGAAEANRRVENLARVRNLEGASLSQEFNQVVENEGLTIFSSVNMFVATVLDFIGLEGLANHFKRAVIMDNIVDDFNAAAAGPQQDTAPEAAVAPPQIRQNTPAP
jgi:hypothetical protein